LTIERRGAEAFELLHVEIMEIGLPLTKEASETLALKNAKSMPDAVLNTPNLLASRSGTCFLKGFTFPKTTKSTTL
jgi:hypothetical protein